jgi:trehalose-6-phosphate synthase
MCPSQGAICASSGFFHFRAIRTLKSGKSSMKQDLVILSNRLPLSFTKGPKGLHVKESSGGLVTALEPLLRQHGGIWIGSAGSEQDPRVNAELASCPSSITIATRL